MNVGRTTGATAGAINCVESEVNVRGTPHSAWLVISRQHLFCKSGDAGAMVMERLRWCGLLFGTLTGAPRDGLMMSVDILIKDIKKMTGYEVSPFWD